MTDAPSILSVGRALPPHHADQETLMGVLRAQWSRKHHNADRIDQLHRSVKVAGRHLVLPVEAYEKLGSFAQANAVWREAAPGLAQAALEDALSKAGVEARELDQLMFVSVTGISAPSVDALLMNRMPLRRDLKRVPVFGLGCVAGAAGIARVSDALRAFPDGLGALVSVELCSLTWQREDVSIPNVIASGLFGDGAAAVLVGGARRPAKRHPRIVATRSVFYPDTERVMGWDIVDSGFKIVLQATVPNLVREHLRGDVDAFLEEHGLARKDIRRWVAHSGGPKVLEAFEDAFEQPREAFRKTWESLET
ncbi:MAG: chalcone/stilbene synthase family protein, partial [Pseudomonadota bacterium]